jgi:hypothetical protein
MEECINLLVDSHQSFSCLLTYETTSVNTGEKYYTQN